MKRIFTKIKSCGGDIHCVVTFAGVLLLVAALTSDGVWNFIERAATIATLALAAATWLQTRRAKTRDYGSGNGDGDWVVAMQCGRPVVEGVRAAGFVVDALVDAQIILGSSTLESDDDYRLMTKAVYQALVAGQSKNIHLFLNGPLALANMIGQMTGFHMFELTVYHYDITAKTYVAVPRPTREWLQA